MFAYIRCGGSDATQKPVPYSQHQQPTTPPPTTRVHQGKVMDNEDDRENEKELKSDGYDLYPTTLRQCFYQDSGSTSQQNRLP